MPSQNNEGIDDLNAQHVGIWLWRPAGQAVSRDIPSGRLCAGVTRDGRERPPKVDPVWERFDGVHSIIRLGPPGEHPMGGEIDRGEMVSQLAVHMAERSADV